MPDSSFIDDPLEEINRLIDLFVASDSLEESPAGYANELDAVKATEVLPCLQDWFAFAGISRAGRFYFVDTETDFQQKEIVDSRFIRFVLYEAGKRYPTLDSLKPTRPGNGVDCPYCPARSNLPERLVCYCGGLGWLLPSEIDSQQKS